MHRVPGNREVDNLREKLESEEITASAGLVCTMLATDGWKVVEKWINHRIEILTNKILLGKSDISVKDCERTKDGKVNLTVVNMNVDSEKHEIQTWKMFLRKMKDFEKAAAEGRGQGESK